MSVLDYNHDAGIPPEYSPLCTFKACKHLERVSPGRQVTLSQDRAGSCNSWDTAWVMVREAPNLKNLVVTIALDEPATADREV